MEWSTSNNNKNKMTVINGSHFSNLEAFYEEASLLFLKDEDWKVGTLDGFDDILYGYEGEIIWKNAQKSKQDLGFDLTKEFYENKIRQGKPFNVTLIQQKLDNLISGNGQTLFEILIEIIESHKNIKLFLE
ncbi:ribonuclease inhibitor [Chryseobacterium aquaticum]|uniref:Ribonuclease inhibitor n=1 Tax=Chryseobacterium aquaticum TaxID=452084 RepID=A0A848N6X4_9FLAO|nr:MULTISPECIES: ribonuclease inhibitor [Chryseobacterium]NMR33083.1 ribonuclease inhibitor [Chryseobacterium aquaticum]NRQ44986.1 ribonuclease inhibitor [Chryseobacterium sp. C-204]